MATILNDLELGKLIGTVIVNGEPSCLKTNSYALRLGGPGEFLNVGKQFTLGALILDRSFKIWSNDENNRLCLFILLQ